ncbi:MAG: hypothetical protein LBO07_02390 [Coriobacteriales bacterium]|jgi:hypothetical protein|nr:hypothetical protein [Coriobacteriales bacterium]
MDALRTHTGLAALLRSRLFQLFLFLLLVCCGIVFALRGLATSVDENQTQFVEDSVRRSAVQCYAIEGRFPATIGGVQYLERNYGLIIDYSRYAIYYESMGANLLPEIRVIPIRGSGAVYDRLFGAIS